MSQLSTLGIWHTVVSVLAVAAGLTALLQTREISPRSLAGKLYLVLTVLTCLTGFGIFAHGGFGKPHVLGVLTLLVLGLAAIAGNTAVFGRAGRYVAALSYSTTFFFHMVPGLTETLTRLPIGAPVFDSPEAAGMQALTGVAFLVFLVAASLQFRSLRQSVPAR